MNYSIYQQALDLQASGFQEFSTNSLGFGLAKYIQIIIPQLAYYSLALIFNERVANNLISKISPNLSKVDRNARALAWVANVNRIQGFFTWKLACDLGFFLLVTQYGPWSRALTFSGLLVYTMVQFVVYYLIGQRLILSRLYPRDTPNRPRILRINRLSLAFSKLFYEELGVTINQVTTPVIVAKILVDYFSMVISWSFYTIGFFLLTQGELNFSPLGIFPHVSMITFYLVIYLGYAFSFTFIEYLLKLLYKVLPASADRYAGFFLGGEFTKALAALSSMIILPIALAFGIAFWLWSGEISVKLTKPMDVWIKSSTFPKQIWKPDKAIEESSCTTDCTVSKVSNYIQQN